MALPDDRLRLMVAWSALAGLLASPPDADTLERVRGEELLGDWPLLDWAGGAGRAEEGIALLRASAGSGEPVGDVAYDHQVLFRGPAALPAPPWESVYLSLEGVVFDEATLQVREFYARHGVQAPKLNQEPDDHISLELEFLATLLSRADEASAEGAEHLVSEHDRFVAEHLSAWAPEFFARVERSAATSFYAGVGVLGADAVAKAVALVP